MKLVPYLLLLVLLVGAGHAVAADTEVKLIALFANKALLQVNGKQKIVKQGETFDGVLLKTATPRGAVVVVDGESRKLGLNQSIGSSFKKPERTTTKIYPDSLGMYYVKGKINGQTTHFLVDTGATYVTMSGKKARELKIDYRNSGQVSRAQTAAAIVQVWQVRLNSVSIGGIKAANVEALVIPGDAPPEVLLGNSFLKHTRMEKAGVALEIKKKY